MRVVWVLVMVRVWSVDETTVSSPPPAVPFMQPLLPVPIASSEVKA
jgi:hypothetical protein